MMRAASVAALALFVLLTAPACAEDGAGGIPVRVGVPYVARGPGAIADSWFTEARLPDGRYRGFTALASTLAIDGKEPYSMGGPAATVLKPGPPGSASSCGEWIQHVELQGKTLLGWVHNETACNYAKEAPGWTVTTDRDRDGAHTSEVTTPTEARHRSKAPPLPGRPRAPGSIIEIGFADVLALRNAA